MTFLEEDSLIFIRKKEDGPETKHSCLTDIQGSIERNEISKRKAFL